MSIGDLQLERLAFFDLELDPFIEVGIRTPPEDEEEEPEGSGGLEIDIVLLSERGTKINTFHGVHGRPLFNGAVALGQEAQGHVEIKLAELPPVCVGLWILAVGSQEWRSKELDGSDVPVEMMVAVSSEPAASGQILATAADISGSGGSVALILRHGNSWTLGSYPLEVSASPPSPYGRGAGEGWLERCTAARNSTGISLELGKTRTPRKLPPPKPLPEAASPHSERRADRRQVIAEVRQRAEESIAAAKQERDFARKELAGAKESIVIVQQERDEALEDVEKLQAQLKEEHGQELEELHRMHEDELHNLQEALANGQNELSSVRDESAKIQDLYDALVKTNKQNEVDLEKLQSDLSEKEDQLQAMRSTLQLQLEGKQELSDLQDRVWQQEREIDSLRKKVGDKDQELEDLEYTQLAASATQQKELQSLRSQLAGKEDKLKELQALSIQNCPGAANGDPEIESLKLQLKAKDDEQKELLNSHEEALRNLDLQVEQLTAQLTTKENHYQQLHDLHQVLVSAGEDQERELERLHEQLAMKDERVKELEPLQSLLDASGEQTLEIADLRLELKAQSETQTRQHEHAVEELHTQVSEREERELSKLQAKLATMEEHMQEISLHAEVGKEQEVQQLQVQMRAKEQEHRQMCTSQEEAMRKLDSQIARFHAQLASKDDQYHQLHGLHKVLVTSSEEQDHELERLHGQLAAKDEELKELDSLKLQLATQEEKCHVLGDSFTQVGAQSQARSRRWEHEMERMHAQLATKDSQLTEMRQMQRQHLAGVEHKQELEHLRVQLATQADARTRRQDHEVEHLRAELEEQLKEMKKLQLQNVTSSEQHRALQGQLLAHEEQYQQLHDQYAALSPTRRQIDDLSSPFQEMQHLLAGLHSHAEVNHSELEEKQKLHDKVQDEYASFISMSKQKQNDIERALVIKETKLKELDDLHAEVQEEHATFVSMSRKKEQEIENALVVKEGKLKELEGLHISTELQLEVEKGRLAEEEKQHQELQDHHALLTEVRQNQAEEVEHLQGHLAVYEEQLKDMRNVQIQNEATASEQQQDLQMRLAQQHNQYYRLKEDYDLLQTQSSAGLNQFSELEHEHIGLGSELKTERSRLDEKEQQHQQLCHQHGLLAQMSKRQEHLVEHLEAQLSSYEELGQEMHGLKIQNTEQQCEIQTMLAEKNDEYQQLDGEYAALAVTSKERQKELDQLEAHIKQKHNELEESELQQRELQLRIDEKSDKFQHVDAEYAALALTSKDMQQKLDKLEAQTRQQEHKLQESGLQQNELQQRLAEKNNQYQRLDGEHAVLALTSKETQQEVGHLEAHVKRQKHQFHESELAQHTLLESTGKQHKNQVEHLKLELTIHDEQLKETRKQNISCTEQQQELQARLATKKEQHEQLQDKCEFLTRESQNWKARHQLHEEEHQELHHEYSTLISASKQKQHEVDRLETHIAFREHQFKESELEQHALFADTGKHHKHMVEHLQDQLTIHEDQLKGMRNLQIEKITSTEQQHELQVRLALKKEQYQELQEEYSSLASTSTQKQEEIHRLQCDMALKEKQFKEAENQQLRLHSEEEEEQYQQLQKRFGEQSPIVGPHHSIHLGNPFRRIENLLAGKHAKLAEKEQQHQQLQEQHALQVDTGRHQAQQVEILKSQLASRDDQLKETQRLQVELQVQLGSKEEQLNEMRQLAEHLASGEQRLESGVQPSVLRHASDDHDDIAAWTGQQPARRHHDQLQSLQASEDEEEALAKISDLETQKLQSQLKLMQRLQVQLLAREHPMTVQKLEQSVERLQAQFTTTLELQHVQIELAKQRRTEEVESLQAQLAAKVEEHEHENFMHEQTVRKLNVQIHRLQDELSGQEEEWQRERDQLELVASKRQQKEIERLHALLKVKEDEAAKVEDLQKQLIACAEQKKRIQELSNSLEEKEDEQQKLQATHDEEIRKTDLETARLQDHHQQLQNHHQQLQDLHAALGKTAKQQELEIHGLRTQLAEQQERVKDIKSLQAQLASEKDHSQELDRLRAHIASQAEARIRRQEQEVAHLRMQLSTREEQLKEMDVLQQQLSNVAGPQDLQQALTLFAAEEKQRRESQIVQQWQLQAEVIQREDELEVLQERLLGSEDEQRKQEDDLRRLRIAYESEEAQAAKAVWPAQLEEAARLRMLGQEALQQLEQTVVGEREGRRKSREIALSELQQMQAGLAAKEQTTKAQAIQIAQMHIALTQKAWNAEAETAQRSQAELAAWSQTAEKQTRQISQLQSQLAAQGQAAQVQTMRIADLQKDLVAQGRTAHQQTTHIASLQNELAMHSQTVQAQVQQTAHEHMAWVHEQEGRRKSREAAQQELEVLHSELAAQGQAAQAQTRHIVHLQGELLAQGRAAQAQTMHMAQLQSQLAVHSQTAEAQTMQFAEARKAWVREQEGRRRSREAAQEEMRMLQSELAAQGAEVEVQAEQIAWAQEAWARAVSANGSAYLDSIIDDSVQLPRLQVAREPCAAAVGSKSDAKLQTDMSDKHIKPDSDVLMARIANTLQGDLSVSCFADTAFSSHSEQRTALTARGHDSMFGSQSEAERRVDTLEATNKSEEADPSRDLQGSLPEISTKKSSRAALVPSVNVSQDVWSTISSTSLPVESETKQQTALHLQLQESVLGTQDPSSISEVDKGNYSLDASASDRGGRAADSRRSTNHELGFLEVSLLGVDAGIHASDLANKAEEAAHSGPNHFAPVDPKSDAILRLATGSAGQPGVASKTSPCCETEPEHLAGTVVQIQGLPARPSLNEHLAEVLSFDPAQQQYHLRLRTDGSVHQLRASNLGKASTMAPPVKDRCWQEDSALHCIDVSTPSKVSNQATEPKDGMGNAVDSSLDCEDQASGSSLQALHGVKVKRAGSISGTLESVPDLDNRRNSHASSGTLKFENQRGSAGSEQGSDTRSGRISASQRLEPQPGQLCLPIPSMSSRRPSVGSLVSSTGWGRTQKPDTQPWPILPLPSSADSNSDRLSDKAARDDDLASDSDGESQTALQDTRPELQPLHPLASEPSFGEVAPVWAPNRLPDSLPALSAAGEGAADAMQMGVASRSILWSSPPLISNSECAPTWRLPRDAGAIPGGELGFLGQLDSGRSAFGTSCAGNLESGGATSGAIHLGPSNYSPHPMLMTGTSPGIRATYSGTPAESSWREPPQLSLPSPAFGLAQSSGMAPGSGRAELPDGTAGGSTWSAALPQPHTGPASSSATTSALASRIAAVAAANQYQKGPRSNGSPSGHSAVSRLDFAAAWMGCPPGAAANVGDGDAAGGVLHGERYEDAAELERLLRPAHPGMLAGMSNYSASVDKLGRHEEALPFGAAWSTAPSIAATGAAAAAASVPRMLLRPPRLAEPP